MKAAEEEARHQKLQAELDQARVNAGKVAVNLIIIPVIVGIIVTSSLSPSWLPSLRSIHESVADNIIIVIIVVVIIYIFNIMIIVIKLDQARVIVLVVIITNPGLFIIVVIVFVMAWISLFLNILIVDDRVQRGEVAGIVALMMKAGLPAGDHGFVISLF